MDNALLCRRTFNHKYEQQKEKRMKRETKQSNRQTFRSEQKRSRRLRRAAIAAAAVLAGGTAVGAAYAAFSGRGTATENSFTIQAGEEGGKIETDEDKGTGVVEPEWPTEDKDGNGTPDAAEDLQPGAVVPKNPKFVSPLSYDAWIAMKVEVPAASFKTSGQTAERVQDCVTLEQLNADQKWELLHQKKAAKEGEHSVYYYAYKSVVPGKKPGAVRGGETSSLFQSIKVPDITALSLKSNGKGFSGSVRVTPYSVQSEGYESAASAKDLFMSLAGLRE